MCTNITSARSRTPNTSPDRRDEGTLTRPDASANCRSSCQRMRQRGHGTTFATLWYPAPVLAVAMSLPLLPLPVTRPMEVHELYRGQVLMSIYMVSPFESGYCGSS